VTKARVVPAFWCQEHGVAGILTKVKDALPRLAAVPIDPGGEGEIRPAGSLRGQRPTQAREQSHHH